MPQLMGVLARKIQLPCAQRDLSFPWEAGWRQASGKRGWKGQGSFPMCSALARGDPVSSRGHSRNHATTFVGCRQGDIKRRLQYC